MYMFFYKHDVYKHIQAQVWKWFFMSINYLCISFCWYFHKITWSFYFSEISYCCVFASLLVYSNLPVYFFSRNYFALPFYLTLQSMGKLIKKSSMMTMSCVLTVNFKLVCVSSLRKRIYWQSIPEPQGGRKEITF